MSAGPKSLSTKLLKGCAAQLWNIFQHIFQQDGRSCSMEDNMPGSCAKKNKHPRTQWPQTWLYHHRPCRPFGTTRPSWAVSEDVKLSTESSVESESLMKELVVDLRKQPQKGGGDSYKHLELHEGSGLEWTLNTSSADVLYLSDLKCYCLCSGVLGQRLVSCCQTS